MEKDSSYHAAMNSRCHILLPPVILAVAFMLGCVSQRVCILQTQELLKPYEYEENRLASEKDFAVVLEVDEHGIKLFGKRVGLCDVKAEIETELKRQDLSFEEFSRAPFLIKAIGDIAYGDVLNLLDVGDGLGFKVKGFMYVDIMDGDCALCHGSSYDECLSNISHGIRVSDSRKPKNWCVIDVLSENVIRVDGVEVVDWCDWRNRTLCEKLQNYRRAYGQQGYEVVIRAHGGVGISLIWRVLNINIRAGGGGVFLVGSELVNESISRTQLISPTYRMIMVGIPCPDGFYWGILDE